MRSCIALRSQIIFQCAYGSHLKCHISKHDTWILFGGRDSPYWGILYTNRYGLEFLFVTNQFLVEGWLLCMAQSIYFVLVWLLFTLVEKKWGNNQTVAVLVTILFDFQNLPSTLMGIVHQNITYKCLAMPEFKNFWFFPLPAHIL